MARPRQSIAVIEAKGRSHMSKEQIRSRYEREIKPISNNIIPPVYLTTKQKEKFNLLSEQLKKLCIIGETDVDALARYIIAEDFYIHATRQIRKTSTKSDPKKLETWIRIQEKFYKQCRSCANDLGLTISSRCKLVVPVTHEPKKRENKFTKFEKR